MLPARKPTKAEAAFAARVRRAIMSGRKVKRADLLKAIDIETAGTRWRKQKNDAERAAALEAVQEVLRDNASCVA